MSASPEQIAAEIGAAFHAASLLTGEGLGSPSNDADARAGSRFDPFAYAENCLGWSPWKADSAYPDYPGQVEILNTYKLALEQQHERVAYESGEIKQGQLKHWQPGQVIKNWIRIESGHGWGKTEAVALIVNHFFDHFKCVGYCFAPTLDQVKDTIFKAIKKQRRSAKLPGEILTLEIRSADDHFIKGRAANDTNNQGTERAQGQHEKYQIYVLEEAEGIPDFVWDAVEGMTSGGISIVLMIANPKQRTSRFHKAAVLPQVASFRGNCLYHPNVLNDKDIVPGGVRRDYVLGMLKNHALRVDEHEPDNHTFQLPWDKTLIYKPDSVFMFRVLGVAPANLSAKCPIPTGRYESACERAKSPMPNDPTKARMGLDCQRRGTDFGKLYTNWNGRVWCDGSFQKEDTYEYVGIVKQRALELKRKHPEIVSLHIRVDAAFGSGQIDRLKRDDELIKAFSDYQVIEVHFGSNAKETDKYYNKITELTYDVAERLKVLAILNPSPLLEADLTEREAEWQTVSGVDVRKLEKKDEFRKRHGGRSPDDGDGFVLAVAGDWLFSKQEFGWG